MADNKKPKTSFAEGLKAQVGKVVPAKMKANEEQILVDIGGEMVPIPRGDMSDERWANVKKREAKPVDGVNTKDKDHDWGSIMSLAQDLNTAGTLISDEERPLLEKADEWDRAEFLRLRMQKRGYKVPINSAQDERDAVRKLPKEKPAAPYISQKEMKGQTEQWKRDHGKISKPEQSAPVEDQGPEQWKGPDDGFQQKYGTETEMSPVSSGPGMSPLANAQQMAMGATGNPMLDAVADKAAPVTDAIAGANATVGAIQDTAVNMLPASQMVGDIDRKVFGNEPSGLGKLPQRAGQMVGTGIGAAMEGVGNLFGMSNMAAKGKSVRGKGMLGDLVNSPGAQSAPGDPVADPALAGAPADPLAVPSDAGSMSASASLKIPSGFRAVEDTSMDGWDQTVSDSKKRLSDLEDHVAGANIVQQGLDRQASDRRIAVEKEMNIEAEFAAKKRLFAVNEATRYETAKSASLDAARKAGADPINPNRYWNNKDDGQKAMAVIAGALFGFGGQGMQWLQRIDGLVNADNQLQEGDRASRVHGLESQARGFGEAADFAMRSGASQAEAHILARQMKYEGFKSYLEDVGAKQKTLEGQTRAQQMLFDLNSKSSALELQGRDHVSMSISRENNVLADQAKLAQGAAVASARIGAAGGKEQKLPPREQNIIANAEAGLSMLPALEKAIGNPNGSYMVALKDEVAKQFPGSDANNRDIEASFLNRNIFAGIDGSVIQNADQQFLSKIQASPGISGLRLPGAVSALKRMLKATRDSHLKRAQMQNQNVGPSTAEDVATDDFGFEAMQ